MSSGGSVPEGDGTRLIVIHSFSEMCGEGIRSDIGESTVKYPIMK